LEISKLIMYRFYYEVLKAKFGDRCSLLFTDTDLFCCEIRTRDLNDDFADMVDELDTSNFDSAHPLYSQTNRRVLGKSKSETWSMPPKEFVGLRAKMYSLWVPAKRRRVSRRQRASRYTT